MNSFSAPIRLIAKPFTRSIYISGYRMYLDPTDNACFRYYTAKAGYESALKTSTLKLLSYNPGCIFIDIGAAYGAYTLAVAQIGKYGLVPRIYSFEPDARCFAALCRSLRENEMDDVVQPVNMIVGDYVGVANLLRSERASTSNRTFASVEDSLRFTRKDELPCSTVDAFLSGRVDIRRNTFMVKVDVEGNELRVMKGMARTLRDCKGFALLFEYYPGAILDVGINPAEIRAFLRDLSLDFAYAEAPEGLRTLPSPDSIFACMDELDHTGVISNFIIGRSLNHQALSSAFSQTTELKRTFATN